MAAFIISVISVSARWAPGNEWGLLAPPFTPTCCIIDEKLFACYWCSRNLVVCKTLTYVRIKYSQRLFPFLYHSQAEHNRLERIDHAGKSAVSFPLNGLCSHRVKAIVMWIVFCLFAVFIAWLASLRTVRSQHRWLLFLYSLDCTSEVQSYVCHLICFP